MRWILGLSLLGGVVAAGCYSDHDRRDVDRRDTDRRDNVPMSSAGDAMDEKYNQSDPVCNMRVNPRSAVTEDWGGKTWYFDTDECRRKFHDNPTAYLDNSDRRDGRDVDRTAQMADDKTGRHDPVCGKDVDPKTATYKDEYGGKTFYFDTKDCWQRFHDNPHAYLPGGDDRDLKREREVR